MWTLLIYLSCRVLLRFCLIMPAFPPEVAMLSALIDSRHSVSSARMKKSSLSDGVYLSLEQAPGGSEGRREPSSLPERGRNPMGDR